MTEVDEDEITAGEKIEARAPSFLFLMKQLL